MKADEDEDEVDERSCEMVERTSSCGGNRDYIGEFYFCFYVSLFPVGFS